MNELEQDDKRQPTGSRACRVADMLTRGSARSAVRMGTGDEGLLSQWLARLLIPILLSSGLLLFPTTCACGSSMPHEHALYGLGHHHHTNRPTETAAAPARSARDLTDVRMTRPDVKLTSPVSVAGATADYGLLERPPQAVTTPVGDSAAIQAPIVTLSARYRPRPDLPPPRV